MIYFYINIFKNTLNCKANNVYVTNKQGWVSYHIYHQSYWEENSLIILGYCDWLCHSTAFELYVDIWLKEFKSPAKMINTVNEWNTPSNCVQILNILQQVKPNKNYYIKFINIANRSIEYFAIGYAYFNLILTTISNNLCNKRLVN